MEEFNILTDFYFPIQEQEKLYNSNAYKNLKNNNIDTAELEGDGTMNFVVSTSLTLSN